MYNLGRMSANLHSRPTTREQLLAAGRRIILTRGFAALTIREVAAGAGANLGSFVYHFGTREAFIEALLESWYAPLFARIRRVVASEGGGLERLRAAILELIEFSDGEDVFLGRVLFAAASGEKPARAFLRSLTRRHPRLLVAAVQAAQQEGSLVREDPLQVLCFLMASVGLPRLLAAAWQGPPLFGKALSAALGRIARDRSRIEQRLDWGLRGLTPRGN
jgi:AcrR family transcriptional regulator